MQSLNDIFVECMSAEVTVNFPDKRAYDNLRTMLVRKLRRYNEQQKLFDLPFDTYLYARWNSEQSSGTFQIRDTESRYRTAYQIASISAGDL